MNFIKTDIEGVWIIEPRVFRDHRGYFFESWSQREFDDAIGEVRFVQDNESMSMQAGVIRGLHFQKGGSAQAKLLRVVRGRVLDVAVDIRRGSPTFGKHIAVELDAESKRMFFIPRGMAHGFAVLEPNTVFQYKCDNLYDPSSEGGLMWNDPSLGIVWPFSAEEAILSEKDLRNPSFAQWRQESD